MRSTVIFSIGLGVLAASCSGSGATNDTTGDASTSSGDDGGSAGDDGSSGSDGSANHDGGGGGNDGGGVGDSAGAADTGANHDGGGGADSGGGANPIKTVFLILMENHNWSQIKGSSSAPYINSLLAVGAHAENYFDNPNSVHPSEPNYIWLEAGLNLGITTDSDPSVNHQSTTQHLVTALTAAGVTWKAYVENITAGSCPITSSGLFAPKHTPMLFFDDIVGNPPSTTSAPCIAHIVPYTKLATDLAANTPAQYNFITPNLCNDMHNSTGCATTNAVKNGDTWLSTEVPKILASSAYQNGGAIFITWDESEGGEFPIGMIVLSSKAKVGYSNQIMYYHSSMVRTVQDIFGVTPLIRDAANRPNLSDLFTSFP